MRGKKPKPAILLKFEGKSHLSNGDLTARAAAEIKIGDSIFIAPDYIQLDPVALVKWNQILGFYRDATTKDLTTSADIDIIAQYCSLFSEQKYLIEQRMKAKSAKQKIKFTTALLKNREMLLKYSNHLYLNPIARLRNIPKKMREPEPSQLEMEGFGNV